MIPVHIDELNPGTRARALEQLSGTEASTTALAILEDNNHSSTYTPAEMRARSIISRMEGFAAKLKTLEDDLRALWLDFENLKAGDTILGCATKKEFCEKKLGRTPRAIQYMLAGGNPNNTRSEIISPVESSILPVQDPAIPTPAPAPKPERTLEDVLDKLVERIALQPCGYYASKFKAYPEQHTTELAVIELAKQEIWQRVVEIGQARLAERKSS